MFNLTKEAKLVMATEMVLTDAMEKGHTDTKELIAYMESKTFENAVKEYLKIMDDTNIIEAEYTPRFDKYIIRSKVELPVKRGMSYDGEVSAMGANNMSNRLCGWHRYYCTEKAYQALKTNHIITLKNNLD